MPRKSDKPLRLVSVKLYDGDVQALQEFYPAPVGYNLAIRTLVHNHVKRLREKVSRQEKPNVGSTYEPDVSGLIGTASSAGGADDEAG